MPLESTVAAGATPADWPGPGPLDLAVQDLPHASSSIEWWYVHAHLRTADGRLFSVFASFFRVRVAGTNAPQPERAHVLTWALADIAGARYFPHTLLDPRTPEIALRDLDEGRGPRDQRLGRALREVVARGRVPLPDRLLARDAHVATDRLALDYDGNRFTKTGDGAYELELAGAGGREGCRLRFSLQKPPVRHGDEGVVRGLHGEDMFYYFSPRCAVEGELLVDGAWTSVRGSGWYDHEFGDYDSSGGIDAESKVGWNWLAAQLDNGYEVSAYDLFLRRDHSVSRGRWVIVVDPAGERHAYRDFTLRPHGSWTSTKTFNDYPTGCELDVPAADLHLDVAVAMPNQEVMTIVSAPAFWEGVVRVTGTMHGTPVSGPGFVERSGASSVDTTDDLFAAVGRETRVAVEQLLPEPLTADQALPLVAGTRRHFLDGIDLQQYSRTVLRPIREIILRGGKAWRSYSVLVCMDLVGGDSQAYAHWLALPELLHVGSLIIDDVEDDSDVRRGGPACHKLYGVALAINAGCASYFLAQLPVVGSTLPQPLLVRIYESYFEAVRAAHAGQALDIDGRWPLMPEVVERGDGALLEQRVLATHRLKSAAPAGALARVATLIGGGSEEQSERVGDLFEAFGLAFQIVDDVLNLRGFEEDRKRRGEDITAGKITAPIAKAMGRLPRPQRQQLASILSSRTTDPAAIREAVQLVDRCGALDACDQQARELVESAWAKLDPVVPDSQFKIRLRAFGWFVLDRHY